MDVFDFRNRLVGDYSSYIHSFINIKDRRIKKFVDERLSEGFLFPKPLVQLNPSFEPGKSVDELVAEGILREECRRIFRRKTPEDSNGKPLRLHKHQEDAIRRAAQDRNYVLTTGTGSGKSLSYIVPIVNHSLAHKSDKGIKAIIVYPMNALANSQHNELEKFLCLGYPQGEQPVTFRRYTGQEKEETRREILENPPDILLTNYVMLELILTRPEEKPLVNAARGFKFLVFDELHTYRGRQGADVALLIRRLKDLLGNANTQCVGTSATLASPGSFDAQRNEVASLAKKLFGSEFAREDIICETLQRTTAEYDFSSAAGKSALISELNKKDYAPTAVYDEFVASPLASWVESTFGLERESQQSARLVRCKAKTIYGDSGAAANLSALTGIPQQQSESAVETCLMMGYQLQNPKTDFPVFAFRLHQFISKGDCVFASLETEEKRHLTLNRQQFVPGDRSRILLPLVFNRECGQEYYCVRRIKNKAGMYEFISRDLDDRNTDIPGESGFLYLSTENPWAESDSDDELERLPEDWVVEEADGSRSISKDRRKDVPEIVKVGMDGKQSPDGISCAFIKAPFRFCLSCGAAYDFRQKSDFGKLSSLGSEGRSTATTVLCLSTILNLRKELDMDDEAKKLLSFTDNRQDASLQAGHFNDFVEVGMLRAAIYKATSLCGESGLEYEKLTQAVCDALGLDKSEYASNPEARFQAEKDTKQSLRDILGYRIFHDLRRGWRITAPNLEQCGLLSIEYKSLDDLASAEDIWGKCHPSLISAKPEERAAICRILLDFMRRSLAIKTEYLDSDRQSQIKIRSGQHLIQPWGIEDAELLSHSSIAFPRSKRNRDSGEFTFISAYSGFGRYLRKRALKSYGTKLKQDETTEIIKQLLSALTEAGILDRIIDADPKDEDKVPGYQINASSMLWKVGDGLKAIHDPISMPNAPDVEVLPNKFFVEFYRTTALMAKKIRAKEHTAQVQSDIRQQREKEFGDAKLPILFCSPTMELGIDIKQLNIVNMRNVPPTPANYSQRSGRAGRSGQPALVFTYCTLGSPHDQYFFRNPAEMVSGVVSTPKMDLANEDLVKAHLYAIWLTESRMKLGPTLQEVLDLNSTQNSAPPSLKILESKEKTLKDLVIRKKAKDRATTVLKNIEDELAGAKWLDKTWLNDAFNNIFNEFDRACDRWRTLYRSAYSQTEIQSQIIRDATKTLEEKNRAKNLRADAESQLELLTKVESVTQSDFYSYRYFASEGFLPGYNFPRLPLSAFIPGRKVKSKDDEFLSRSRFLAITEFGPRSIVYHEGSKYIIDRVIIPPRTNDSDDITTGSVKICEVCGYLHHGPQGMAGESNCSHCHSPLPVPLSNRMFRLQNVVAKRRERINSDEEERFRLGYEMLSAFRFAERNGRTLFSTASVSLGGKDIAVLKYGHAATLWRINLGWKRRADKDRLGFVLDVEKGYWAKNEVVEDDGAPEAPIGKRTERVIPYVEDHRNTLIYEFKGSLTREQVVSLEAALGNAIQAEFQLEDSEIACELLPNADNPICILFYESAEGGAGVLRRLVESSDTLQRVARKGLELCHFNPDTGEDLRHAANAKEDCEAACYDCLLSYYNQPLHRDLDRKLVKPLLAELAEAEVKSSPSEHSREEHHAMLCRHAESGLERKWLDFVLQNGYALPTSAQGYDTNTNSRPDFRYEDKDVVVFVDGPPHDDSVQKQKDREIDAKFYRAGTTVIRFHHKADWEAIVKQHKSTFGTGI